MNHYKKFIKKGVNEQISKIPFHNNASTIFSWAVLPVFAGSVIQTNSITLEAIIISGITAIITYVLITTSRKYKHLKRDNGNYLEIKKCESVLKIISIGVLVGTLLIFVLRFYG